MSAVIDTSGFPLPDSSQLDFSHLDSSNTTLNNTQTPPPQTPKFVEAKRSNNRVIRDDLSDNEVYSPPVKRAQRQSKLRPHSEPVKYDK